MDRDLDQIPKSVRREPIRTRNLTGFDIVSAISAAISVILLGLLAGLVVAAVMVLLGIPAYSRDAGQWQATDANVTQARE